MIALALILAATSAEPETRDAALLSSGDALYVEPPQFPQASRFLGATASCLTVYQVNQDGSTRPDCVTCDVEVDLGGAPLIGETLTSVSRGELESRLARTFSKFRFAPEHAGRWGRTYFDFILEGDDINDIPDRPEPARCPIPDIQSATP